MRTPFQENNALVPVPSGPSLKPLYPEGLRALTESPSRPARLHNYWRTKVLRRHVARGFPTQKTPEPDWVDLGQEESACWADR